MLTKVHVIRVKPEDQFQNLGHWEMSRVPCVGECLILSQAPLEKYIVELVEWVIVPSTTVKPLDPVVYVTKVEPPSK